MATATVTSKGQITIPAEVRRQLGLHTGSRVSFVRNDEGVYELRPQISSIAALKGAICSDREAVTLDEMDAAIRDGASSATS